MTQHAEIERVAFDLFEERGFDETTLGDIAEAVGVGRRTLFRYFPSKNDIPWGQFDESLRQFHDHLAAVPNDVPVSQAVQRCVVAFNDFDTADLHQHRVRMKLVLTTPTLQAHSALRYAAWRRVIADYVATRTGAQPDDLGPRLVGHISLALAVAAYEQWLDEPGASITQMLHDAFDALRAHLAD